MLYCITHHALFRGSGRAARHNKFIPIVRVQYCIVHIFRRPIEPLRCTPPCPRLLALELDQLDKILNGRRQPRLDVYRGFK